jgi:UDP-N-acetylglucosamine 2-epimerase (non-hydrolysing)
MGTDRKPLRVLSLMGTRPEAIKLAPVQMALASRPRDFEPVLCVTGQHRQMLDQVMADFGLTANHDLNLMVEGQGLADLSARVLPAVTDVLRSVVPDIMLVQGDTTSAAMGALAAFYERIPVGHVEAGLRTGDRYNPFPEEINRRLISDVATWHYAPTQGAVDALLREGTKADSVLLTGNTVVDALLYISGQVGDTPPSEGRMILVTAHRRESFGPDFESICLALRDIVRRNPDVRIVYPVHLNPNVREPVERILTGEQRVELIEPVGYRELVGLMKESYMILTDSGGIQEEAPVLGKPVLVLRQVTERPEAVAAGAAKVVGTDRETIVKEAELLLNDRAEYERMARAVSPYGDGHAAERIADHLATVGRNNRPTAAAVANARATKSQPRAGS